MFLFEKQNRVDKKANMMASEKQESSSKIKKEEKLLQNSQKDYIFIKNIHKTKQMCYNIIGNKDIKNQHLAKPFFMKADLSG